MASATSAHSVRPSGRSTLGPRLIGLPALGMFINYVDRGNLATAAPLIKDELGLSNTEAGILLSAFFWTYMPFQLVAGWLAERFSPYRILAIGVAVWSFATFATGFVTGFTTFSLAGIGACMLVCMAGTPITSIVALLGSGLFFGMGSATIFSIGQTLAGPHAAGKWMGVQNCVGNLAGIIAPFVTGYVVDRTGDFSIAFAIAAAVTIFGIVGWASIPRIETLDWSKRTA